MVKSRTERESWDRAGMSTPRHCVIDLYSGAGGLSLGAARAGFAVAAAVETDPQAYAAHSTNFPKTVHFRQDVSRLTGQRLMEAPGIPDEGLAGVIGGPPCQGFSCIGKNDASDERNGLFVYFFKLVAEMRPRFFLVENVPGILGGKHEHLVKEAIALVEGDYSVLPPIVLAAHEYGAPTTRRRAFFFGYRSGTMKKIRLEDFAPPTDVEQVRVREALDGLPVKVKPSWQTEEQGWRIARVKGDGYYHSRLHGQIPPGVGDPRALERLRTESRASGCLGTRHSRAVADRYASIPRGTRDPVSKSHRLDPAGFCPTIRAGTGSDRGRFQAVRPLHPIESRVITPREAARLQGFPDWFQFHPTKWHSFRQIGSSVSPILAERLLAVVFKALKDPKR